MISVPLMALVLLFSNCEDVLGLRPTTSKLQSHIGNSTRVLLTFDDEGGRYHQMALEINRTGIEKGGFDRVIVYPWGRIDADWKNRNSRLLSIQRGHGHFVWKPYIINDTLNLLQPDDILCYIDSKYSFQRSASQFWEHEALRSQAGLLFFHNKPDEPVFDMSRYVKHKAQQLIGYYPPKGRNSGVHGYWEPGSGNDDDSWAGFLCMRHTSTAKEFVRLWLEYCENIEVISRDEVYGSHDRDLINHQEDQAVLSLLIKKHSITMWDMPAGLKGPLKNSRCQCNSCHEAAPYKPGCSASS